MNKRVLPPKLAIRLFQWYCRDSEFEDLQGDLDELFNQDLVNRSPFKAKFNYWIQVCSLMLSYTVIKRKKDASYPLLSTTNNISMIKNYFKVAYRSLLRQKFFSIINVFGLAIGMSVSLLLLAVIGDVIDYDKFHKNRNHIYRVISKTYDQNQVEEYASSPQQVAKLVRNIQGIDNVVRLNGNLKGQVKYDGKYISMSGFFVDPGFFDVFSFKLAKGDPKTALQNPNNLLITHQQAIKLFSSDDPMGKIVSIEPFGEFIITGILEDHPKKSHLHFDIIGAFSKVPILENQNILHSKPEDWENFLNQYTYLNLSVNADPAVIEKGLSRIGDENQPLSSNLDLTLQLQSMNDITLGKELNNSIGPQWDIFSMIIFGILSFLILAPACFNYANISMARSLKRAKEIGVRKVIGSQRRQIFWQFIVETMIVCLASFILAYIGFFYLRIEFLAILAPASSAGLSLTFSITNLLFFLFFVLLTGFLIGLLPAIHFSKIQPLKALKNNFSSARGNQSNMRKVILTFQFTLSLGFIMAVMIVINQYRYSLHYELGFQRENILNIDLKDTDKDKWLYYANHHSEIAGISFSSDIPGIGNVGKTWIMGSNDIDSLEVFQMFVDQKFLTIHEIPLISGETFPEQMTQHETHVVINQSFAEKLGYPIHTNALGQTIILNNGRQVTISGIVNDFNYAGLREKIEPFFFRYVPGQFNYVNLRLASSDIFGTMNKLERHWKTLSDQEFSANFLSEKIDETFQWYIYLIKMIGFLGLLAISISVLGLFGMVVFVVDSRTKEVGIRKVHGASSYKIVILLSKDYFKLMIIAVLVAVPLTYLLFNKMLPFIQHYSAEIGWGVIVISTLLMFIIGSITVTSQTIKAAKTNPAETLKYE